jgi:hypothetical protein
MFIPDAVELHPCTIVGTDADGKEIMEQCEENDPAIACWSVYWHVRSGGLVHVEDFATKAEAESAEALLNKALKAMEIA